MFISLLQPCPPENAVTSQPWVGGSLRIAPVPRSPRVAGKKLLLFCEQFCYIIQRPDFDCPHFLDEETEDSRGVVISPGTHSQKWMPAGFGSKVFVSEITACFLLSLFLLLLSIPFQWKGSETPRTFLLSRERQASITPQGGAAASRLVPRSVCPLTLPPAIRLSSISYVAPGRSDMIVRAQRLTG